MARIRSPGYPNAPLGEVIDLARKVHEAERQHPVSREVAAQHMGFAGATGSSDRAISALFHYGLVEKVVKGELRVTDLAVAILHAHTDEEKRRALHQAGFQPSLFRELRERYSTTPPSLQNLSSYLSRVGFASAAILPAAKAYIETCSYLQRLNAYESEGEGEEDGAASGSTQRREEPAPMNVQPVSATPAQFVPPAVGDLTLNEPNLTIRGGTVRVEALLDLEGVAQLEEQLKALKSLMRPRSKAGAPSAPSLDETDQ